MLMLQHFKMLKLWKKNPWIKNGIDKMRNLCFFVNRGKVISYLPTYFLLLLQNNVEFFVAIISIWLAWHRTVLEENIDFKLIFGIWLSKIMIKNQSSNFDIFSKMPFMEC